MIDLSLMRGTGRSGQEAGVGGGATWKDLIAKHSSLVWRPPAASSEHRRRVYACGGFGWLMPRFGMALDNLRAVRLVADGSTVGRPRTESRVLAGGGGGNRAAAVPASTHGRSDGDRRTVAHLGDRAKDVMRFFRDRTENLPDEAFLVCALLTAPDGSGHKIVGLAAQHSSLPAGEAFVKPIVCLAAGQMPSMPYVAAT
jgi:hypothetical protein